MPASISRCTDPTLWQVCFSFRNVYKYMQQNTDVVVGADSFKLVSINGGPTYQEINSSLLEQGTELEGNLEVETITALTYPIPVTVYSTAGTPPFKPDVVSIITRPPGEKRRMGKFSNTLFIYRTALLMETSRTSTGSTTSSLRAIFLNPFPTRTMTTSRLCHCPMLSGYATAWPSSVHAESQYSSPRATLASVSMEPASATAAATRASRLLSLSSLQAAPM